MTFKDYIEIFSALLIPLIAILAAYIAWRQYQIDHHSLRNALYERRYVVFKAFMVYLSEVVSRGKTTYARNSQFYAEASEDFLFSRTIADKREELYQKGVELAFAHERMYPVDGGAGLPVGAERDKVAEEAHGLLKWFTTQIQATHSLFKQEMKVG